ncbi:DUF4190 domain-containing protein [Modestobacter altitudinis]|uniref:DUF4190 domain-containing protein n=1 Tax=Modestobacter altitudinis TaxID=2213158 RepID=UPI00110CF453|nr:DUF4190 domain-containing protein [Modestobacter altitudinis]
MTHSAGYTGQQGNAQQNHVGNGLAIAGLVCGLVGLLFFPIVLGPLAIIFGGIGLSRANRGAGHKGMSIAAIVLGIADLVVMVVYAVALSS